MLHHGSSSDTHYIITDSIEPAQFITHYRKSINILILAAFNISVFTLLDHLFTKLQDNVS